MPNKDTAEVHGVAVTGAQSELGALLLPLLLEDPAVERVLALDVAPPTLDHDKLRFVEVDLTRPGADAILAEALQAHRIDALYHLAFLSQPISDPARAHEVEVLGSLQVLAAAGSAQLRRLIVPSITAVYGAQRDAPALLPETAPLRGCPASRLVSDRVEVEKQVRTFRAHHPRTRVLVLRFAPVLGASVNNPVTRFLRAPVVPTLLGFDPLWQALHEEDAARALHLSLHAEADGEFNVASEGVLPLSGLLRLAGARAVPMPAWLATASARAAELAGATGAVATALVDFLRYSCVADDRRARTVLGFVPRHHAREAAARISES
jgi:UDP-glucose 4-epimerase